MSEIANSYVKKDALESALKHPDAYLTILQVIADRIGKLLNTNDIAKDFGFNHLTVDYYLKLMQKSFHIVKLKPFYRNLTKELRKMSKVFFMDLGLRNYFIGNFDPLALRDDRGDLLENFVLRRFIEKYSEEDIKYWRTQKKQEVDFIIQDKTAYEVKFSESLFKPNKFSYFQSKYPEIPLKLIHYANVLEIKLE